ncbi:outer membrane protein assembly factor BamD [Glaciecola sp. HTCC2999]|uniref:outer membrane protein assembly factor BamD n=1 Tax=Glaciecola sp. HTCC2999 TaxID=455436 RepID=UPI0000E0E130|nr:outer membrane protein assembly factor BamD [Glaciecola sp. HTCC2999]
MKIRLYALSLIGLIALGGCSSAPEKAIEEVELQGPQAIYAKAKTAMENGNFGGAAEILSDLDSRYPFGELSHQVQLDLIYSYYKSGDSAQALATIDRFIRLNPNHKDIDYAYFMRGLTNMEMDDNLFQSLFNIDRSDRDPSASREAFNDFRQLLDTFPESKYATDAQKRMVYIKTRLAKYEIAIARFYMRREAYVAAANRGQYVLEYYPDTGMVQEALEIMVSCYDQLGLDQLKANAIKILKLNYPESEFIL